MNNFKRIPASNTSIAKRSLILGVGVNDSSYITSAKINGKEVRCPIYRKWHNMLTRSCSAKYQSKNKAYKGVSVCNEWLVFSAFSAWFEENSVEGFSLDKDLKIKGNKIYSPETCLFIPCSVNNLISAQSSRSDFLPVGVSFHKRQRMFCANLNIDGNTKYIGSFNTPTEAHEAYKKEKNKEINRKMKQFPEFAKYLVNHLLKTQLPKEG